MTEAEKIRWFRQVSKAITERCLDAGANLQWLQEQMHPYMSVTDKIRRPEQLPGPQNRRRPLWWL